MRSSVVASAGLHIAVVILAAVGLPSLMKPPAPEPLPMVVELVTLSDETNVPTRPKEPEPPKKEEPKPEPKPEPPKQAEQPPPTPPKSEPQPQVSVPPPEPKPQAKPEAKPEPKPEPKPQAPQELTNTRPAKKPKAPQEDFDSVLKNLAKTLPQQKNEPKAEKKPKSKPSFDDMMTKAIPSQRRNIGDPDKPLTMTERDLIRNIFNRAMQRCWNIPAGAKDAAELIINVRISLAPDGSVLGVRLEDSTFGKSDFWRAAADSAVRAVRVCSPYTELPANLYESWKDTVLTFNPREMLGG